uniref:DsrE family protein n=1 Tax=Ningiella ruwaisensis TaxID=2364274 RepID=UPI001F5038B9|nr:DsrE family protein [Ningiella ruwaisensis]
MKIFTMPFLSGVTAFSRVLAVLLLLALTQNNAYAVDLPGFEDGPVIQGFGKHAKVPSASLSSRDTFKIAFDVAAGAGAGEVNRKFDSLARFINMHVASGVPKENIELVLVVHGKASIDLLKSPIYARVYETDNANVPLLQSLMDNGVRIILCGQTAKAYEISVDQLVDGISVELSAMTAHALLQQQGFTVNPF